MQNRARFRVFLGFFPESLLERNSTARHAEAGEVCCAECYRYV